mgnify:CR=1 FL=1
MELSVGAIVVPVAQIRAKQWGLPEKHLALSTFVMQDNIEKGRQSCISCALQGHSCILVLRLLMPERALCQQLMLSKTLI